MRFSTDLPRRHRPRFLSMSSGVVAATASAGLVLSFALAAPTASAALPSRGSAAIGTASYAVPSGAIFVSTGGSDSNSGSQSSPLRTLRAATVKASSGKTIVMRQGTYNESVTVASSKRLTIQNYPHEAVWLDGSIPVRNWTQSGSRWVSSGWRAEFGSSMGGGSGFKTRFIGSNPMAADPDQVFINGVALRQVSSASNVTAGTFAVNDSLDTITIGSSPSGNDVRASNLSQGLNLSADGSVVQGIGVRRYATPYELRSALRVAGDGGTVRNVVVQDNAMIGLTVGGHAKVVDHVTSERNGMMGIGGNQVDGIVVKNSKFNTNNTELFKDAPVSGGIKFTATRTATVANTEAKSNHGSGIWFDASSYNMNIVNNVATNNSKHQIEIEVSSKAIVANNVATGGETGIMLFDAANIKVFNNEVGGSRLFSIKLAQDERRQASSGFSEARDPRAPIPDSTVTWVTKNITLSNNAFGNGGMFQFYALDGKTYRAVDGWNVVITGNLFNKRVVSSNPTMVAWGKGDNHTLERYETPSALASAKNSGWRNAQTTSSLPISSMGSAKSANASVSVGLPSDVAAAVGKPSGTRGLGILTF